jgi:SAM-dependent methyltransferase
MRHGWILPICFLDALVVLGSHPYVVDDALRAMVETTPEVMNQDTKKWPSELFQIAHTNFYANESGTTYIVVYKGPDASHDRITQIKMQPGSSVHRVVTGYCDDMRYRDRDEEECKTLLRDSISWFFYGISAYSSTRPHGTTEDWTTTRTDILKWLVNTNHYAHYLEIGCADGKNFHDVASSSTSLQTTTCVDPSPDSRATVKIPSDEFFLRNDAAPMFFDLVFIDGLHEANQVFRDFRNAWRVLREGGAVVLHDCNPSTEVEASYPIDPRVHGFNWNGDVWKAVVAMRMMPDADLVTIDVDNGITVVRRRKNEHQLSDRWRDFLSVNPISMLNFQHLKDHREELLPLVSVEEFRTWWNTPDR